LKGLVVSDHKISSLAGQQILKLGGNAADAAVAVAAAMTVIDPYMAGLGGYGYALIYNASEDKVHGIDYIGTAPLKASIDLFTEEKPWEDYKPSTEGMLSALVPGIVAGWLEVLDQLGTMKFSDVLKPAIELAKGHRVSKKIYSFYESIKSIAGTIPDNERIFYSQGHFPKPGETLSQPSLAHTLETLALRGGKDYYEGSIARKMVSAIRDRGGMISMEDLARYQAIKTIPVSGKYRDYEIYSHRPGSSGITILQWLNILEGFDFSGKLTDEKNAHLFLEAGKLALRDDDRWNTGKINASVPIEKLTSKDYASRQRSNIKDKASFYKLVSTPAKYGSLTKHHCTCDERGNVVAMTETQMYGFDRIGVIGELGFNINSGMCYFSLDPNHHERIEPGARPRYVMSPTIAFKDDEIISAGAAGGWTIPQTITQTLFKFMQFGMGVQEAVSSPRFVLRYRYNSIPYSPGTVVDVEAGIPQNTVSALVRRGHKISVPSHIKDYRPGWTYGFGAVNALSWSKKSMEGGAESRRDGCVAKVV